MSSIHKIEQNNIEILIVEDSPTQALQLQQLLEKNNYKVKIISNGLEALSYVKDNIPGLIISDIIMPEMDGFEFCRNAKAMDHLKDIPVMLLTTLSDPEDVIKALECGADNFVTKPYREKSLISSIKNILISKALRKGRNTEIGVEIFVGGNKHFITSDRMQIIDLLFSTYENAIQKNRELDGVNRELIMMQQQLEQRNIELEKLNEQKNRFLGMAAHDLRNPLGSIMGISEMLAYEDFGPLTEDQAKYVTILNSASENMLTLVDDLLDVSIIESGRLDLQLKEGSLKELIEDRLKIYDFNAKKKNMNIHTKFSEISDTLFDPNRIIQVFDNLMSNAIKFSPQGSNIYVILDQNGKKSKISVRDEGPGISGEDQSRLFGDFQRLSAQPTGGEKSTGLGLAIVKKIIDVHNGTMEVDSKVGSGSTFSFTLPMK